MFRSLAAVLIYVLLSLVQTPAQGQANEWDSLNLDEKFFATAHGYLPSYAMGTEQWSQLLAQIAAESTKKNKPTEQSLEQAALKFPAPQDLSLKTQGALSALTSTYQKFRLESPESEWFKNERLPARISDAATAISLPADQAQQAVCPPPRQTEGIANILDAAAQAQAATAQKASTTPVATSAPATTLQTRAAAVAYANSIKLEELSLNPTISARDAAMAPPKANINQWATGASINRIIFHHTATGSQALPANIQAMHFNRGWSDVGYHFLIAPDGTIYEGRSLQYQGANAEKNNHDSIGVAFIGNFEGFHAVNNPTGYRSSDTEAPSEAAIQSALALSRALMNSESHLNKTLTAQGLTVSISNIIGHTDCKATACPGDACLPLIRVTKERLMAPPAQPKVNEGEKAQ